MNTKAYKIGAPTKGECDAVEFNDFEYPVSVSLENHMNRRLVIPEFGLILPVDHEGLPNASAVVENSDRMKRLVSDIEQLAELNDAPAAVTLTVNSGTKTETDTDTDTGGRDSQAPAPAETEPPLEEQQEPQPQESPSEEVQSGKKGKGNK